MFKNVVNVFLSRLSLGVLGQPRSLNIIKPIIRVLLVLLGLLINIIGFAANIQLPHQSAVPGGVVKIAFSLEWPCSSQESPEKLPKKLPKAYFNNTQVLVLPQQENSVNCNNNNNKKLNYYNAIIGLPLSLKPGRYYLSYYDFENKHFKQKFTVQAKNYKTSRITVANHNMVEPDDQTAERIMGDQVKITQACNKRTGNIPISLELKQPVLGSRTTSFGSRRIINNISKNPHTGMDIAAGMNSQVIAAADGTVILAENFYLPGNMVAINHGSGLVTLYAHLNQINVKVGQVVKAGDLIGLVGKTGRVTGPHLHWAVKLNQAAIDPELFLKQDTLYG